MFQQSKTEQIKDKIEDGVAFVQDKVDEAVWDVKKAVTKAKVERKIDSAVYEAKGRIQEAKEYVQDKVDEIRAENADSYPVEQATYTTNQNV